MKLRYHLASWMFSQCHLLVSISLGFVHFHSPRAPALGWKHFGSTETVLNGSGSFAKLDTALKRGVNERLVGETDHTIWAASEKLTSFQLALRAVFFHDPRLFVVLSVGSILHPKHFVDSFVQCMRCSAFAAPDFASRWWHHGCNSPSRL